MAVSRTAEFVALFRALETVRPAVGRLFEDRFAYGFLPAPFRAAVRLARVPVVGRIVPWIIDRRWPGPRGAAVVRTRFIDDAVAEALRLGVRQFVIVGAGFDSRACRIPGIEGARVVELDAPVTQRRKQDRLRRMCGALPAHVRYLTIDLNRERLADVLAAAGIGGTPSFFILEGITNYLSGGAVDEIMRFLGSLPAGSRIVFTYIDRRMLDRSVHYEGDAPSMDIVRRSGEPFVFGFVPDEVAEYLAQRGLTLKEHVGAAEYRRRYLAPLGRSDKVAEFYWAALAEVRGPVPAPQRPPAGASR